MSDWTPSAWAWQRALARALGGVRITSFMLTCLASHLPPSPRCASGQARRAQQGGRTGWQHLSPAVRLDGRSVARAERAAGACGAGAHAAPLRAACRRRAHPAGAVADARSSVVARASRPSPARASPGVAAAAAAAAAEQAAARGAAGAGVSERAQRSTSLALVGAEAPPRRGAAAAPPGGVGGARGAQPRGRAGRGAWRPSHDCSRWLH